MPGMPEALSGSAAGSVLGFDYGTRLIGIAVGNRLSGARALTAVNGGERIDWQRIDALIADWRPSCLVVGLPLRLDGGEQPMSLAARDFAKTLQTRYDVPVRLVDERHTSGEAARRFAGQRAAGKARRKDAAAIDAVAAEIILESWFAQAPDDA